MLVLLVRCVRGLAQVGSAGISSRIRGCVVGGSQLVNAIMRHDPVSDARHVRCFFFSHCEVFVCALACAYKGEVETGSPVWSLLPSEVPNIFLTC
jgi:hypothetical protein